MSSPGTSQRLGPYELIQLIGEGGMGEVWRARDTRLNRDVAVKLSAAKFSGRFDREARAIAALNHPNICTLHDVGPNYLVMELIEGPTLADRIAEGPIPLDESLAIAKQIAEAIDAAHEKGIVHRDLKPGNIKLRPDGAVKVLDFGLAKSATQPETASDSPTMTTLSAAGVILGTAGYMSPEQARGQQVGKRSDIFAFGVVLYELLTGERLFDGATVSDTIAAVLTREPDYAKVLPKVRRLLRRCLEKDPQKRLRDIGDWRELLDETPGGAASDIVPSQSRSGTSKLAWAAAGVFALIAAAISFLYVQKKLPKMPVTRFAVPAPEKTSFDLIAPAIAPPALSPDGRRLVFGAGRKLWLQSLDTLAAQPLAGTENGQLPFWSPDGKSIGFFAAGKLKRMEVAGGPVFTLADARGPRGGSWSSGGMIVFAPGQNGGLVKIPESGGAAVTFTKPEPGKETLHRMPWFLPDGKHFLFTGWKPGSRATIHLGSIDSPEIRTLLEADSNAVFAQGYLLFLRGTTLMAQPFDPGRLALGAEAALIAEQVAGWPQGTMGSFSASGAGTLVYAGVVGGLLQLTWFDRAGRRAGTMGDPAVFAMMNFSPDRKSVAASVHEMSNTNNTDIWMYDVARGIRTRFTSDPAGEFSAVWSPDGATVVFDSSREGRYDLYRKQSTGDGAEELLYADGLDKDPTSWSPDGKFLLYWAHGNSRINQLWILPNPLGKPGALKPYPLRQTPFDERFGLFSPDGKWIAFQSDESGRNEIYAIPFPGPGAKRQISAAGGRYPRWRGDGKEVFYLAPDNRLTSADIRETAAALEVEEVHTLFGPLQPLGKMYDVSADGQRILAMMPPEQSDPQSLTVVENWTAGLKK